MRRIALARTVKTRECLLVAFAPDGATGNDNNHSRHLTILWSYDSNKKQFTFVSYAPVLLLMLNFVITLSKFTAVPLTRGSWLHSHFDNVMTQFIIIKKTDANKLWSI